MTRGIPTNISTSIHFSAAVSETHARFSEHISSAAMFLFTASASHNTPSTKCLLSFSPAQTELDRSLIISSDKLRSENVYSQASTVQESTHKSPQGIPMVRTGAEHHEIECSAGEGPDRVSMTILSSVLGRGWAREGRVLERVWTTRIGAAEAFPAPSKPT